MGSKSLWYGTDQKLIVAWIEIHSDDLLADWELAINGKPLFKIKGLDQ